MSTELDSIELKLHALMADRGMQPESSRELVGTVVGGTYEIVRKLGSGGMGEVFVARHLRTGGELALKLMRPRHEADVEFVERFALEARNTAALNHPNIVKVFDYGQHDGLAYIAMELVAGRSVAALLESGPLQPSDAMAIAAHTLRALQAAHEAGLVHRDVKPDNILVAQDGNSWFVKVVDFGIAHALGAEPVGPQTVIGTPHSMAPEQFRPDGVVTPRADLYALGCTTYAMLTGRPPFEGTFWELSVFHAEHTPPPLEHVPEPLADWVKWLLAKSPDERPPTAHAALDALLEVSHGRSAAPTAASLPRVATSFVGRDEELAALDALWRADARLVTITGVGGLGKTRLALEWARRNARQFAGGAYFCDLAETKTADEICIAVAHGIGASLGDGAPPSAVGRVLAGRGRALVILDNFEQVASCGAETVGAWRQSSPDVTFVLTSRHRLGLRGEHVLEAAPLATDTSTSEGVQLFVDRAASARADFAPPTEDLAAIRELVAQLDGLPLAIEMAAARVRTMQPETILARLGERFRLLRSSRRDISERQMTMQATLDWSWDLLDAAERAALRQCAVFAGSFDLAAAEAVVDLTEHDDVWVVDVLESLLDKSLLRRAHADRFALFVSVQEYAAHRLAETGEAHAVRLRHLRHFAQLGTETAIEQREESRAALDAHGREIENLQAAVAFGIAHSPSDETALCAIAVAEYFHLRGPLQAAIELGNRVLEALAVESADKARLFGSVGLCCVRAGEYGPAVARAQAGRELAERVGDLAARARATMELGFVHMHFHRLDEAEPLLLRAAELAEQADNPRWRAGCELFLGSLLASRAQLDAAETHCRRALEISVAGKSKRVEGWTRRVLAAILRQQGRMDEVFVHARRSLDLAVELGETVSEAWALSSLGDALADSAQFAAAIAHYEACLKLSRECGDESLTVRAVCMRAVTGTAFGHPDSRRWVSEALDAPKADSHLQFRARAHLAMAELLTDEEPDAATRCVEEAWRICAGWPGQWKAQVLLTRAMIRSTRSATQALDDIDEALASLRSLDAHRLMASCLVEKARILLSEGDRDAALGTCGSIGLPRRTGTVELADTCVRTQVLAAHGRLGQAAVLCDEAVTMRDALGLYPASRLSKLVEQTLSAVKTLQASEAEA